MIYNVNISILSGLKNLKFFIFFLGPLDEPSPHPFSPSRIFPDIPLPPVDAPRRPVSGNDLHFSILCSDFYFEAK